MTKEEFEKINSDLSAVEMAKIQLRVSLRHFVGKEVDNWSDEKCIEVSERISKD